MSDSSLRTLTFVTIIASAGWGCSLVLDLDAEGDVDAQDGGGGVTWTTSGPPSVTSASGTASPSSTTGGPAQTASSSSTGSTPMCGDGYAAFDGAQLFLLSADDALNREKNFAIQARVRPAAATPGGSVEEGAILSRINDANEKGYELVVVERENDGVLYPELRLYTGDKPCRCEGSIPIAGTDWVRVAAAFTTSGEPEAAVWVGGSEACMVECDGDKVAKFAAAPTIGRAMVGGAFYRGTIAEIFVRPWSNGVPDWGDACSVDPYLALRFDATVGQTFLADCTGTVSVTFGGSAAAGPDDPQLVPCP